MYNVLLVDDEIAVTNSLMHMFEWKAMGLQVVGVAPNGEKALEIISEKKVDIVITDICMTGMDGMSLCKQIYNMDKNIQIIIISGFANFSYAQQAIIYETIGYCLKPLDYDELKQYLNRAIHYLNGKNNKTDTDELLSVLYASDDEVEIQDNLESFGFSADKYYVGASVGENPLSLDKKDGLTIRLGHNCYGYLVLAPFVEEKINEWFRINAWNGFSYATEAVEIMKLGSALSCHREFAYEFFFDPEHCIVKDREKKSPHILREINRAATGNKVLLNKLLAELKETAVGTFTINWAWNLYNIIIASDVVEIDNVIDGIFTAEHLVYKFTTFSNMIDIICQRLQNCSSKKDQDALSNRNFLKVLRCIDENLTGDCSLSNIAEKMNMNSNYLGQVFKREMGKTYTTYITELRIEKAKQMIDAGNLSLSEISDELQFSDYFYFLKTFKRITGVTPKQYRMGITTSD